MWRYAVFTSASVLCFLGTAVAEDSGQPPESSLNSQPPEISWAGYYVGVNGGYGWSARHPEIQILDTVSSAESSPSAASIGGGFGGLQVGHSWQEIFVPHLVLGIEADFEYAGIGGNLTASALAAPLQAQMNLDSFGALKGRIGYAWAGALFYAAAGVAFGDVEDTVFCNSSLGKSSLLNATTRLGWVAGGGLELPVTPKWSFKAEYQFLDLESECVSGNLTGGEVADAVRACDAGRDYHTIRAGLNYHFGAIYQPLK
jgi:outer membrane immunogenic protein